MSPANWKRGRAEGEVERRAEAGGGDPVELRRRFTSSYGGRVRAHYSGLPAAASVAQAILTAQALILKEYERARSQPPSAP